MDDRNTVPVTGTKDSGPGAAGGRRPYSAGGSGAGGSLDLTGVRFAGTPLSESPLRGGDDLVLMGRAEDVTAALRAVAALPGVLELTPPGASRQRVAAWLRQRVGRKEARLLARALRRAGLPDSLGSRTRLDQLDAPARFRLLVAAICLLEQGSGALTHLALPSPFSGVPGHLRAGLRTALVRELRAAGLGAVLSTDSAMDAVVLGARTIELDAGQVAQAGDVTTVLGRPRGGLSAALGSANVMSGLARKGWLSIGHSQVRRRTELDGKVYLAIPTDAVTLSADEFDPAFGGEAVFEVIVVGVRDEGSLLQVRVSPADAEAGLPLVVDVLDASPRRAWSAAAGSGPRGAGEQDPGWAILHPGLGETIGAQLTSIAVGSRLWAEVDTARIHVWSVED